MIKHQIGNKINSMNGEQPRKRRRISLATQVFIGLCLGILVGLFFGEKVDFLKIGGDAVTPYVVVALITFIALLQITIQAFCDEIGKRCEIKK